MNELYCERLAMSFTWWPSVEKPCRPLCWKKKIIKKEPMPLSETTPPLLSNVSDFHNKHIAFYFFIQQYGGLL